MGSVGLWTILSGMQGQKQRHPGWRAVPLVCHNILSFFLFLFCFLLGWGWNPGHPAFQSSAVPLSHPALISTLDSDMEGSIEVATSASKETVEPTIANPHGDAFAELG